MDERSSSTTVEAQAERPEFEAVELTLALPEATAQVHETVEGLYATDTDEGIRFRSFDGMLVAVLDETDGTVLLYYRTEPATESATRKARKLRAALTAD
jgi:hypothetical protein